MTTLLLGLVLFLGIQSVAILAPAGRDRLAARLGLAWKAGYAVVAALGLWLVVTGFWNIAALTTKDASSAWKAVLMIKIAVVVVAGVAVFLHQRSTSKVGLAVWGAVGALASIVALCLGVFLAG